MTKTLLTSIEYILLFAKKQDLTSFCTAPDMHEIEPMKDENDQPKNSLGRVWNHGMGFLKLAEFTGDGRLLLNEFLLEKAEIEELKTLLKPFPHNFIYYDKPNFYHYTFLEFEKVYEMRKKDKSYYERPQNLFKK